MTPSINRRSFLVGCSAAIAAMSGGRLTGMALGAPNSEAEVLVTVFLRGGWDALSVLPPLGGPDRALYEAARTSLRVPVRGKGAALELGSLGQTPLGLHPALEPLHDLYKQGVLAVIPATGLPGGGRSHFEAQETLERGAGPGSSGWMTRFLDTLPDTSALLSPAMALQDRQPSVLRGRTDAVSAQRLQDLNFTDDEGYRKYLFGHLDRMWTGDTALAVSGRATLKTLQAISGVTKGDYQPAGGARYPEGSFGDGLQTLARSVRSGLGVRAAAVDLGGWDTHQWQGMNQGEHFWSLLSELGSGLRALYQDLASTPEHFERRLTVVVMSEFGRRLSENDSGGTDHGHGGAMLLLGGSVRGGKLYGRWPGLDTDQLFERADLDVTTDYRAVFSEILLEKFHHPNLAAVFPGFKPGAGLGLV
jgi:uncharacterized protein (DUF1501 family)